jgi:Na+/H+-dicarboxylate symporter
MKKLKLGLFPKVVIAIVIGALLGLILPDVIVRILKTFNVLFAQLLKFVVPLLVLGLVTPSIANLGRGAGKMLLTVMLIAYCSTVCGALFSYGVSSNILPMYLNPGELSAEAVSEKEFLPYIDLKIPPICDIMTALVLSFVIGVGIIFTGANGLKRGFEEFGEIVKLTIEKVIIPFLPVYIFTMICEMSAQGVIDVVLGTGFKVILTGVVLSILYLVVQYCIAGIIARKNPLKLLWNVIPAYLTGFSICSSSACIPVTYECTLKNGVRKDIADFVIPLCSTVHMCGSTIKLTVTSVAVAYMFGAPITFGLFMQFALMQAIAAVAAPGVMGGVLMASVGLLGTVLGFSDTMTTLMMTIYLALDGYGPAVNVSGDAAIAVIADKLFGGKKSDKAEA